MSPLVLKSSVGEVTGYTTTAHQRLCLCLRRRRISKAVSCRDERTYGGDLSDLESQKLLFFFLFFFIYAVKPNPRKNESVSDKKIMTTNQHAGDVFQSDGI